MAPVASSLSSKLKAWISVDSALITDGKTVLCQTCDKRIGCTMKSQIDQHLRSNLHIKYKQRVSSKKQVLLTQLQGRPTSSNSEFYKELCMALVAGNIPWNKLQVPEFKHFLQKYCNRNIPDESTLRKNYLDSCYLDVLENIRNDIGSSPVWISADGTTDAAGRFIANLIVGKMDSEAASKPYLIYCKPLEVTNSSTIARFINDGLKVLWQDGVKEERVLLMYTDAAPYMLKAGKSLAVFYPNLVHVTCMAHALQRVAETVRHEFPEVNSLISATKKVFLKCPYRIQRYKEQLPDVPLPPEPVITRWATWIEAVIFYSKNFEAVKSVMENFSSDPAVCVSESLLAFNSDKVLLSVSYIASHFSWLPNSIKKLETSGMVLQEAVKIMEDAVQKVSVVPGEVGSVVSTKMQSVLNKNPGYPTLVTLSRLFNGENVEPPKSIIPSRIPLYKYAPLTSCEVERSFSIYKNILSDRRLCMTAEHLEKYIIINCGHRSNVA